MRRYIFFWKNLVSVNKMYYFCAVFLKHGVHGLLAQLVRATDS